MKHTKPCKSIGFCTYSKATCEPKKDGKMGIRIKNYFPLLGVDLDFQSNRP